MPSLVSSSAAAVGGGSNTPGAPFSSVQYNSAGAFAGSSNLLFSGSTLSIGTAGSALGILALAGSTSGVVTVLPSAVAGTWTLTLPSTPGTANQVLQTHGSGTTSWVAAAASAAAGGSSTQVQFNTAGVLTGSANLTFSASTLSLGLAGSALGIMSFAGNTSGATLFQPAAAASGTITLPAATDTLVGKATTDTLTNKTLDTAGVGNSLLINGIAATANSGTGAVAAESRYRPRLSDAELLTLAVLQVLQGFNHEARWRFTAGRARPIRGCQIDQPGVIGPRALCWVR